MTQDVSSSVVITGLGLITPVGIGVDETWSALHSKQSGIAPVRGWDASEEAVQIAAQLPEAWESRFRSEVKLPFARRYGRFTCIGLHAAQQALTQAQLLPEQRDRELDERAGVCFGVGGGATHYLSPTRAALLEGDIERFDRSIDHTFVLQTMFNAPAGLAAIQFGLQGPSAVVSAACASGSGALAQALDWLRCGRADWVLVGGCDSTVDRETVHAYQRVGALTEDNERGSTASRSFDAARSGFVMAEGGAALVLETAEHAAARGAQPIARLCGAGLVSEAHKIASPLLDGSGMVRSMRAALADAGMRPEAVGHVSAHAPSTPQGDLAESRAIASSFGTADHAPSVTAPKSMLGHAIGASSAIATALTALSLQRGEGLPTAHLEQQDPEIDARVLTEPTALDGRAALVNAFGFGGHNISLVLDRA